MSPRDRIYATELERVSEFEFDERTAQVFEDMIVRSVPGYRMSVTMTGLVARHFARPGTSIYDLGSALGACVLAMSEAAEEPCRIIGVDNSSAMIDRCRHAFRQIESPHEIQWRCEDVRTTELNNASVVVLNLTLQFLPLADRKNLIEAVYQSLLPGGVLVLTEKIDFEDKPIDDLLGDLHHSFKRANGYDDLEISQKRQSLENVLVRETLDAHERRLRQAGFAQVTTWLQCFNFVSLLAVR